ncbi:MAG: site-2 protease family protein [Oscillospiraceae bacterium]|jgi:regulator of sigma E protease|nr:site-2 protease family protein [Oscillospiraceae bacterium]
MYIVIAIIIFGVLITVHELGHFISAKLLGVKVTEFAVGMGPALFKRQRGETLYALRALPIGGFCAMEEDEESDDPRAFVNKAWWKRLIILVAGSGMNFLAGFIVLLIIVPGSAQFAAPVIVNFFEGCPYEGAQGLQVGDEFYKIDGHRTYFRNDVNMFLKRGSGVFDIVVERGGQRVTLEDFEMVPIEYELDGQTVLYYGFRYGTSRTGVASDFRDSWNASLDFVRMVWMGLGDIVTGQVGLRDLSGPVGIVDIISDVGEEAPTTSAAAFGISYLAAFIAINLAVMNMLPIPALDGGRVFFLLLTAAYEGIAKRKLNPKYEGYIHGAGMVLMLGFMAVVMFSDVYKLIK